MARPTSKQKTTRRRRSVEDQLNDLLAPIADDGLSDLLTAAEPIEKKTPKKAFSPTFNPREEFATWMRQHYMRQGKPRTQLINENRKEIYKAALLACQHGAKTARTCIQEEFREKRNFLREMYSETSTFAGGSTFADQMCSLVRMIEELAQNLGGKHYGTKYKHNGKDVNARPAERHRRDMDRWNEYQYQDPYYY